MPILADTSRVTLRTVVSASASAVNASGKEVGFIVRLLRIRGFVRQLVPTPPKLADIPGWPGDSPPQLCMSQQWLVAVRTSIKRHASIGCLPGARPPAAV